MHGTDRPPPRGPDAPAQLALTTAPLEALGESPPFIEIARLVPAFGGFWFNQEDQIVVGLTDLTDFQRVVTIIPKYLGAHQPSGGYVGLQVERSFADLARFRASLRDQVFREAGVVTLGVKESANRVEVGISTPTTEAGVRSVARALGIADEAVAVVDAPAARVASHTLRNQHPTGSIEGGWEVHVDNVSVCTLGFPAIRSNGSIVFVTNSHCTPTSPGFDGVAMRQPSFGHIVGYEVLDPAGWLCPGSLCRHSDAVLFSAIVPVNLGKIARTTERTNLDQTGAALTIDHANPAFTISGRNDYVYENELLDKVGRSTGWSYGAVEDTCTDHEIDDWTRLCSDRVDFAVQGGDSGSPVFYWKADGTAELRGIVFGWEEWPANDGLMSNLHQIELDLGPLSVHAVIAKITGPSVVTPRRDSDVDRGSHRREGSIHLPLVPRWGPRVVFVVVHGEYWVDQLSAQVGCLRRVGRTVVRDS